MANKRIPDLPAAAAAAAANQLEIDEAGTSKRLTNAQIATFIQTALNLLTLVGGKLSLGNDGSIFAANGAVTIDLNGNVTTNGFVNAGGGLIQLLASGAFFSANGVAGNDASGNVTGLSISINGGAGSIASDGSAQFVSGTTFIDGAGNLQVGTSTFINADGTAQFGGNVRSDTLFNVAGTDGLTQDFNILDGGVPKVFHFTGGILTSVT